MSTTENGTAVEANKSASDGVRDVDIVGLDSAVQPTACECAYCGHVWDEDGYIRNHCPDCGVAL